MDNNNYQPQNQQPQYEQPQYQQPMYQQPIYQQPPQPNILPPDIKQRIDNVFGKALAATIMAEFPIASIIALIFGKNALIEILSLIEECTARGIRYPGKLRAAKILATIGKFAGLGFTIFWGAYLAFFVLYFGFIFFMFILAEL